MTQGTIYWNMPPAISNNLLFHSHVTWLSSASPSVLQLPLCAFILHTVVYIFHLTSKFCSFKKLHFDTTFRIKTCQFLTKRSIGKLFGITLIIQINLGRIDIFIILSLPTKGIVYFSNYVDNFYLQFSSAMFYSFLCINLVYYLLEEYTSTLYILIPLWIILKFVFVAT